jgi:uncharacterized protein (TIGR02266 family)
MTGMEPPEDAALRRRAFPRFPLQVRVCLEFREQRFLLVEWATNFSRGGMFVRSESPRALGDRFEFEAKLSQHGPPLGGTGEIVWIRTSKDQEPAGMGVRFLDLDETTGAVLNRLEEAYRDGGTEGLRLDVESAGADWERKVAEEDATLSVPAPAPFLVQTEVIHPPEAAQAPEGEVGEQVEEAAPEAAAATCEPPEPRAEAPLEPPVPGAGRVGTQGHEGGGDETARVEGPSLGAFGEGTGPPLASPGKSRSRWGRRTLLLLVIVLVLLGAGLFSPRWKLPEEWLSWTESTWGRISGSGERGGLEVTTARSAGRTGAERERVPRAGGSLPPSAGDARWEIGDGSGGRGVEPRASAPGVPGQRRELRAIEAIERRPSERGLLVAIRLDGPVGQGRARYLRLDDPRRFVVILSGIAQGYAGPIPDLASEGVSGVRLGFHQGGEGPEQHIVFDLASREVVLESLRARGHVLEVLLSGPRS